MSVCQARITGVAEQVAAALCRLADPAASVTVERAYAPDWLGPDFWKDNAALASTFTGRRAYVFGARETHEGAFTRGEDENRYAVTVVVFELYTGDADAAAIDTTPPQAWADERAAWVERNVFDALGDARADPPVVDGAEPLSQDWTSVYSPDLLRTLKLFRSEVTVTYRRIEDTR